VTVNTTALLSLTVITLTFNGLTIFGGSSEVVAIFGCAVAAFDSEVSAAKDPVMGNNDDNIKGRRRRATNRRICYL
jgi:hypothetical protein